jgi:hypothetical protein
MKGYLPRVIVVYILPQWREGIEQELAYVSRGIGVDIKVGYDDMFVL